MFLLQNYLDKYGYFGNIGDSQNQFVGALKTNDDFTEALRCFQGVSGIEETGVLDAKTLQQMQQPRCGMPDGDLCAAHKKRKRRYATSSMY